MRISEPSDFKRGVHISVDTETGRLNGVPDAWKSAVPPQSVWSKRLNRGEYL